MKIKLLIISLFLPILIWGQNAGSSQSISVGYIYKEGQLNIDIKNLSGGEVFIQNEREYMDGKSAIKVKLLDANNSEIYNGRWGIGLKSQLMIQKNNSINLNYPFDMINVNKSKIKKIVLDVYIKYTVVIANSRKPYFYKESKELLVK